VSGTRHPARTRHLTVLAVLAALTPLTVLLATPVPATAGSASAPTRASSTASTWAATTARPDPRRPRTVAPDAYAGFTLDRSRLLGELSSGTVEVPDPDGQLVAFRVAPTRVLEPGLAAAHPELQTWAGSAVGGPGSIRLEVTPGGVHASVRGAGPSWYVDPAYRTSDGLYLSYAGAALPAPQRGLVEPKLPARDTAAAPARPVVRSLGEGPGAFARLRTYRLALLSDSSFAAYTAPGANNAASDAAVLAAKTVLVDRLDQIYGADLGIKLVLVNGTDTKLNLWTAAEVTGANGPCGQSACFPSGLTGCTSPVLDRQQWVIGQLIGARNFDVGHLALGVNGGGIAYLGVVGTDRKASGCTGLTAPSGDAYTVDYLAHELGHQFGADHTFDGTQGSCGSTGQRAPLTAVEPGSGSTIMAYAGICGADDLQSHSDPVFSTASAVEVGAYVAGPPAPVREVQSVSLTGFDNSDSFQLVFGASHTTTIQRGVSYTSSAIASAVLAVLPSGSTVSVNSFWNEGSWDDRGFTLSYTLYNGGFWVDVPEPTVAPVAGAFTAAVNDIYAGGPSNPGGTVTTTSNHNPTVDAGADATIPVRTPFSVTGSATDVDGDALSYLWEQTDTTGADVGTALGTQPKTAGPLFRVFGTASSTFANHPTTTGVTRSFPDLDQVLAGNTNADTGSCPVGGNQVDCLSEWLPTAAYTPSALHLRLTALDSSAQAGGVASDDLVLTLDKTHGPFRVTSQATSPGTPYAGGSLQTVTWTAGTSTLAANVKVTLSTDGGATFPYVLAASTPNNGSAQVTLPDLNAGAARIRVQALGNYFYDVNDAPFAIQASGSGTPPLVVDHSSVPATWNTQYSDPATVSFSATGGAGARTAAATTLPAGLSLSSGGGPWTISGTPTVPGSYPVTVTVTAGAEQVQFDVLIVVAAEDSTVAYTGPPSVVGPDPDADAVPVTITAQVTQAADGSLGPIGAATVTFTDADSSTVLCATAPVITAGTGPGTATCSFDADLSAADQVTYHVALSVGGSYRGSSATAAAVTVALPNQPDPVPPDTTITSGPAGWLFATQATFGLASSVAGSAFTCRLDGVQVGCAGGSVTLTGLTQGSHRLSVAAEDAEGDPDATAATRDFAVPVDDTRLAPSRHWQRKRSGAAYLGGYAQARHQGATLSYKVSGAQELALLVRTGRRAGSVKVYLGKALLATVRTAGPTGSRTVRIGHFPTPRSGTVRIVSTSSATVRIDGLGVSTYPF